MGYLRAADFTLQKLRDKDGYGYLLGRALATGQQVLFKRHLTNPRALVQEFQVHKAAYLACPGVAEVFQLLKIDNTLYLAQAYCPNTLFSVLQARRSAGGNPVAIPENESLLLHLLLKVITTLRDLHSLGITHGDVCAEKIWEMSKLKVAVGGFERAQMNFGGDFKSRVRADCCMVGVLLAQVITNRFDIKPADPLHVDAVVAHLRSAAPYVTDVCLYLVKLAEQLLTENLFNLGHAIDLLQIVQSEPLPNALTITKEKCIVCKNSKPQADFVPYDCPLKHRSCSECFDMRANSIAQREFEDIDLCCIICDDFRIHPRTFAHMVRNEAIRVRVEQSIVQTLCALCHKCHTDLGFKTELQGVSKLSCHNCRATVKLA